MTFYAPKSFSECLHSGEGVNIELIYSHTSSRHRNQTYNTDISHRHHAEHTTQTGNTQRRTQTTISGSYDVIEIAADFWF